MVKVIPFETTEWKKKTEEHITSVVESVLENAKQFAEIDKSMNDRVE